MSALFTVSYWIALVTVLPGFVTIAAIFGGIAFVSGRRLQVITSHLATTSEWIVLAIGITFMVLTQACGILLEEVLVNRRMLGRRKIQPHSICRYEEYSKLYLLLTRLKADDDAHGHLRRAVAQFFLTLNTMVSFSAGIAAALIVASLEGLWVRAGVYTLVMFGCLGVSYPVAVIRFREMARTIWAANKAAGFTNSEDTNAS